MAESTTNRDEWLAQIEKSTQSKAGDKWKRALWSEFLKKVVWWLRNEESRDDEDAIAAAVGLVTYRIKNEDDLKRVAGQPPDGVVFNQKLKEKGIPAAICDILFNKYLRGLKKRPRDEGLEEKVSTLQQMILDSDFAEAWKLFYEISWGFVGGNSEEPESKKCNPVKIRTMWEGEGGNHVGKQLAIQCATVDTNMQGIPQTDGSYEEDSRAGRVVGIRLGSGCGKTHLLLEAPRLLEKPGIFITYNLEQTLLADKLRPRQAILLRVLLRLAAIPHSTSDEILNESMGKVLLHVGLADLRKFVVNQLATRAGKTGIVVAVDEVMALARSHQEAILEDSPQDNQQADGTHLVRQIISELGVVATDYYKTKPNSCYVFMTSLRGNPFYTDGGKAVVTWSPKAPDEEAAEAILESYLRGRSMERLKALLIASAGFHFRSMVFAAQAIGNFDTPSVQSIVNSVFDRWQSRVEETTIEDIKALVVAECRGSVPTSAKKKVEQFLDGRGAVPPSLVLGAFGTMTKSTTGHYTVDVNSPLYKLFNCENAFTDDTKQLEQFGESFDLFRAQERLPVLSEKVEVHVVASSTRKSQEWFKELSYPDGLTASPDSLFQTIGGKKKSTKLSQAGISPSIGKYYSPGKTNHPFVDRAFIANSRSAEGELCFVLIQDKVNNDVPKAVGGLNKAGKLLQDKHPEAEILCILNVIGAGPNTTSQNDLDYSFVLVGEKDLDTFYGAHFAAVARFIRKRHELGERQRREEEARNSSVDP